MVRVRSFRIAAGQVFNRVDSLFIANAEKSISLMKDAECWVQTVSDGCLSATMGQWAASYRA
jgi:hypothetical protein